MPAHHHECAAEQRFERISAEDTMEQRDAGYESPQASGRTRADRCSSPAQCRRGAPIGSGASRSLWAFVSGIALLHRVFGGNSLEALFGRAFVMMGRHG